MPSVLAGAFPCLLYDPAPWLAAIRDELAAWLIARGFERVPVAAG